MLCCDGAVWVDLLGRLRADQAHAQRRGEDRGGHLRGDGDVPADGAGCHLSQLRDLHGHAPPVQGAGRSGDPVCVCRRQTENRRNSDKRADAAKHHLRLINNKIYF